MRKMPIDLTNSAVRNIWLNVELNNEWNDLNQEIWVIIQLFIGFLVLYFGFKSENDAFYFEKFSNLRTSCSLPRG